MATSKFYKNHKQLISFGEKLYGEVKTIGDDVQNQIKNLADNDNSNCLLLKAINRIVGDTFNVIGDLQVKVIRSTEQNVTYYSTISEIYSELCEMVAVDLKDVVSRLSQYCYEMVEECENSCFDTLKQKFLLFLENIIRAAESLLNIIKTDNIPDFQYHQLVETLKEILFTIQMTQVTMKVQYYTKEEIIDANVDMQQEVTIEVQYYTKEKIIDATADMQQEFSDEIEKCSLEVLKNLLIHIRHIAKHNLQAVNDLHNAVSNFDDAEMQRKILESTILMNLDANSFLLFVDSEKCHSIQEIIATLKLASIYSSIKEILLFIHSRYENEKVPGFLIDLATYLFVHCYVVNKQIGKIIQHVINID